MKTIKIKGVIETEDTIQVNSSATNAEIQEIAKELVEENLSLQDYDVKRIMWITLEED